jgi:hypothetical protein
MKSRDFQRSKVYALDRLFIKAARERGTYEALALEDMEGIAKKIFPHNPPEVRDGRGRRAAGGAARYITMPVWSRNNIYTLHELSHTAILRLEDEPHLPAHGGRYMAVYKQLLITFGILDSDTIDNLAKEAGVKIYTDTQKVN